MKERKTFTFDGENSADYGLYISGDSVYNAPNREIDMISIPGRNGQLAIDMGRYENITVTYPAFVFAGTQEEFREKIRRIRNWLCSKTSYQRLTDEYNPESFRLGLYKSGLEVEPIFYNRCGEFEMSFDCKPQRFLFTGEEVFTLGEWGETETYSGSIVSFEGTETTAIKTLNANIVPKQNLNGQSNPYPPGGGKNLLDPSAKSIATGNSNVYYWRGVGTLLKAGTYTVSYKGGHNISAIYVLKAGTTSSVALKYNAESLTFTLTEPMLIEFNFYHANGFADTSDNLFQLEVGSNTTPYAPYSNICPISGTDAVDIVRSGGNLFDGILESGSIRADNGQDLVDANACRTNFLPIKPSSAIYYQKKTSNYGFYLTTYGKDKSFKRFIDGNGYGGTLTTNADEYYVRGRFNNVPSTLGTEEIMVSYGDTRKTYIAPNGEGETITTNLGQTVYGGTLEVMSGKLTINMAYVDLGSLTWRKGNASAGHWRFGATFNAKSPTASNKKPNAICSKYPTVTPDDTWLGRMGITVNSANHDLLVVDENYSDADTFKASLNGVQFVYELITPIEVTLTPTQVNTLLGSNNIWADSGDVEVEIGENPYILVNPTKFESLPIIETQGAGTLTINNSTITITNTGKTILDSEMMEAYMEENGAIIPKNDSVSGEFPKLPSGANTVSRTGITSVKITPRWWTL